MAKIEPAFHKGKLSFRAAPGPSFKAKIKDLGGKIVDGVAEIPRHRILDFEDAFHMCEIVRDDTYWANRTRTFFGVDSDEQTERATMLHQQAEVNAARLTAKLFPYQGRAVSMLNRAGKGLLGDEPGLGKTIQGLAWALLGEGPCLIVCPANIVHVWEDEIQSKTTAAFATIQGRKAKTVPTADFVIIPYTVLGHHESALERAGFASLILDEAHYIKGRNTTRSKTSVYLGKKIPRALLLSGTFLSRGTEDLYPALQIVRSDDFPSWTAFRHRYCQVDQSRRAGKGKGKRIVGSKNTDELEKRLSPWAAFRSLDEVRTEMPEKRTTRVRITLTDTERSRYRACMADMRAEAKGPQGPLPGFSRLVDVVNKTKTTATAEMLEEYIQSNRKVLVFSQRLAPLDAFDTKNWEHISIRLSGQTPPQRRASLVREFQTNNQIRVAFCQLDAAGEGITLDAADTVILIDPGWTPSRVKQAIGRALRVTSKTGAHVVELEADCPLDRERWRRLDERGQALQTLHGATPAVHEVQADVAKALLALPDHEA